MAPMGTRKTLQQIITEAGSSRVARRLNYSQSYISKVSRGASRGSTELLGRALGTYGPELDVEASLRELVPDEVEAGAAARQDGEREGVDHGQG